MFGFVFNLKLGSCEADPVVVLSLFCLFCADLVLFFVKFVDLDTNRGPKRCRLSVESLCS